MKKLIEETTLVLQYDFKSLKFGTIVNDISGNGNAGVVRPTGSEVCIESVEILGKNYTSYVMKGGQPDATHTYIELPNGIMNGLEDATISCWVYFENASSGQQRVWYFGNDMTSYVHFLANGNNHVLCTGEWVLTTVTFDGSQKEMSFYENGQLIGTEKMDTDLAALAESTQNWIGYGPFENDIFNGKVADFKIYNYKMSAKEVAETYKFYGENIVETKASESIDRQEQTAIEKAVFTKKAVRSARREGAFFTLDEVSLDGDDTIYAQNKDRTMKYLKIMDADRMLYAFRATYGLDTKGAKPLTGWDEPTGLLRGHSTGHFLSALAQAYASSGDESYRIKLDYMIHELRGMQKLSKGRPQDFKTVCTPTNASQKKWSNDPSVWGEGYLSAYSPDQFALLEQYTPYATIWAPYYTLHKILAGFLDCYNYVGNEEALEAAEGIGNWVYERLSNCTTKEQRTKMWAMYIAGEYGGINESLARLYELTGEKKYIEAAKMFDNKIFFDGLAKNEDTIQHIHANQHIPQIVGAMHEYAATGDSKYYNIAKNFWNFVVRRYAYSIGGVGTGECFKDPYKQGANILGNNSRGENCETCAAYNMLKLTLELYNYNLDDAAYMDYYERTLINQIVASQNKKTSAHSHNGVTYMLPIDPGQRKEFDLDYGEFTCCNGTGMENHVKYQAAAYSQSGENLYVNLYMPTTLNWEEKGIEIKQETKFPSEHSRLTVSGTGKFIMKLRVPYWATKGFTVKVNGKTVAENPEVSTYVNIDRTWSDGDVVTIDMPYPLHLDKTPDKVDGDTVASVMYGPIVMAAKDTRDTYIPMNWYKLVLGDNLEESIQVITGADSGEVPHLRANGIDFYPMYDADDYRYHAYVKVVE